MGLYNSVWFKNKTGEDVELQFKINPTGTTYSIGDKIELDDAIYFCHEGSFIVFGGVIVAAFDDEYQYMVNKWGYAILHISLDN